MISLYTFVLLLITRDSFEDFTYLKGRVIGEGRETHHTWREGGRKGRGEGRREGRKEREIETTPPFDGSQYQIATGPRLGKTRPELGTGCFIWAFHVEGFSCFLRC